MSSPDSYSIEEEEEELDEEYELLEEDADADDSDGSEEPKRRPTRHPMLMFLHLFWSPVKAWKRLKNSKVTPEEFAAKCFYPLLAVMTACNFLDLLRNQELTLAAELQKAVCVFIAFFLGYFCVLVISKFILPEDAREKIATRFGRVYLMAGMASLALFFTIGEVLPDLDALIVFFPLFTIYLSARGAKYLRIKKAGLTITGWMAGLLEIFVPYGLYELLLLIMPAV